MIDLRSLIYEPRLDRTRAASAHLHHAFVVAYRLLYLMFCGKEDEMPAGGAASRFFSLVESNRSARISALLFVRFLSAGRLN